MIVPVVTLLPSVAPSFLAAASIGLAGLRLALWLTDRSNQAGQPRHGHRQAIGEPARRRVAGVAQIAPGEHRG